jgi:hypothetical protein
MLNTCILTGNLGAAGVLDLATQKGLLKLEVELLQFPTKENGNEAICRAVAGSATGEVFSDIGDANPSNCHSMIVKHLIRMASTRAKGRALRDLCNMWHRRATLYGVVSVKTRYQDCISASVHQFERSTVDLFPAQKDMPYVARIRNVLSRVAFDNQYVCR